MSNSDENLLAILGPTNTGKTYTAFEKLFSYSSGIFGFAGGSVATTGGSNCRGSGRRFEFSSVEKILSFLSIILIS